MYSMQRMRQKAHMHLHSSRAQGLTQVFSRDGNMKNGFAISPWSVVIVCLCRDGYMMRQRKGSFFFAMESNIQEERRFPFKEVVYAFQRCTCQHSQLMLIDGVGCSLHRLLSSEGFSMVPTDIEK